MANYESHLPTVIISRKNLFVKFMIIFTVLFVITIECFIILGSALTSFFFVPSYVFFAMWYFCPWLYFCLLPKTTKLIIPKNDVFQLFSKRQKRVITLVTIGPYLSLVITFHFFLVDIYQYLTLGAVLV